MVRQWSDAAGSSAASATVENARRIDRTRVIVRRVSGATGAVASAISMPGALLTES